MNTSDDSASMSVVLLQAMQGMGRRGPSPTGFLHQMQERGTSIDRARRQHSSDAGRKGPPRGFGSSQEDDSAGCRKMSCAQCLKGLAARGREGIVDRPFERSECRAVRSGGGQQQNRLRNAASATFQRDPPLDGLEIDKPRLRLDANAFTRDAQDRVPGAQIHGGPNRHLGVPGDAVRNLRSESSEKQQLRSVPDRRSSRIRPGSELEADDAQESRELDDGDRSN
jgi:hypothetical protein